MLKRSLILLVNLLNSFSVTSALVLLLREMTVLSAQHGFEEIATGAYAASVSVKRSPLQCSSKQLR